MATISQIDKMKLETLFDMKGGYVCDFSNNSLQRFINNSISKDIYDSKYDVYGTSKANRLRAFWEIESDNIVGKLIEEMLLYFETRKTINKQDIDEHSKKLVKECLDIAHKLQGKGKEKIQKSENIESFLKKEVDEISISLLRIDGSVSAILEQRILEVKKCLQSDAALSAIFLCGSILEGILLSVATMNAREFNQSSSSPKNKDTGKVKQFHEWSLNNLIDVAYDLGFIGLDVQKYSHSLRDFRNYIHPYQQMSSGFNPDMHTAKISWQVLKATISDLNDKSKYII